MAEVPVSMPVNAMQEESYVAEVPVDEYGNLTLHGMSVRSNQSELRNFMERSLDVKANATEDVLKSGQDNHNMPRKVACRKPSLSVEKKQESYQTMNGYWRAGADALGEEGVEAVESQTKCHEVENCESTRGDDGGDVAGKKGDQGEGHDEGQVKR